MTKNLDGNLRHGAHEKQRSDGEKRIFEKMQIFLKKSLHFVRKSGILLLQ